MSSTQAVPSLLFNAVEAVDYELTERLLRLNPDFVNVGNKV